MMSNDWPIDPVLCRQKTRTVERDSLIDRYVHRECFERELAFVLAAAAAECAPQATALQGQAIRLRLMTPLETYLTTCGAATMATLGRAIVDLILRLHGAGICHRDLHVANMVVSDDGRPYAVDFELAAWVSPSTRCYDLLGPTSGTPLPIQHVRINLRPGVWWDAPGGFVRTLANAFGSLATVTGRVGQQ